MIEEYSFVHFPWRAVVWACLNGVAFVLMEWIFLNLVEVIVCGFC
jgi:hypothetical protein